MAFAYTGRVGANSVSNARESARRSGRPSFFRSAFESFPASSARPLPVELESRVAQHHFARSDFSWRHDSPRFPRERLSDPYRVLVLRGNRRILRGVRAKSARRSTAMAHPALHHRCHPQRFPGIRIPVAPASRHAAFEARGVHLDRGERGVRALQLVCHAPWSAPRRRRRRQLHFRFAPPATADIVVCNFGPSRLGKSR